MIRGIVIAAYLGWIAFGAVSIILPSDEHFSENPAPFHIAATSVLAAFWALFVKQRSPMTFYVYILFPCYFWDQVLVRASRPLLQYVRQGQAGSVAKMGLRWALVVAALQSMVVSIAVCRLLDDQAIDTTQAGYTHRSIWSAWFVAIGVLWPIVAWSSQARMENWQLLLAWTSSCLGTAVFPLLSVHQEENLIGM